MWFLWLLAGLVLAFGLVVFRGAPYVPSHRRQVVRAFNDLYELSDKDVVIDAGSGDGIVLRIASSKGARAIGYELNPILVLISRFLSRQDKKVRVQLGDFWLTPLPLETTLVYGFLVSRDTDKMTRKLQQEVNRLRHPLYYISYGATLENYPSLRQVGAHYLYKFKPLQIDQP